MRPQIVQLIAIAGLAIAAAAAATAPTAASAAGVLTLTSPEYQDNATLADKSACSRELAEQLHLPFAANCVGQNISPPLAWQNPPPGTKSFALVMRDPEGLAPAGVDHMVIYGIPADAQGFAAGELSKPSDKFVGGKNRMGVGTYFGPGTPPNADWHHYTLTLIATDLDPKALQPGMTRDELAKALGVGTPGSHVKGSAGLILRFRHPVK